MSRRVHGWLVTLAALAALGACRDDMFDQQYYEPLEASPLFGDRQASRPLPPGTVARGRLWEDDHLFRGRVDGQLAEELPFPATRELLERGRERYGIYCTPCHGLLGRGDGMIVQRGFRQPPSFHGPSLREAPIGHFYDVIQNGFGSMPDYAAEVRRPEDRWAIAAYIRALQRSQDARLADVPPEERQRLEEAQR